MVSVLFAVAFASFSQATVGPNLLTNPGLARQWDGWTGVWSRDEGAAVASIVSGEKADSHAIYVKHTGTKDWALSQRDLIQVKPGDLYQISARMKSDGGQNTISVVSRDAAGNTLN